MTQICVSKLTIIGSKNGLSPDRRQATICTNDGILLIGALGTNFSEILIEIQTFSFFKNQLKVSSEKWRPFCLGLNVKQIILPHMQYTNACFYQFNLQMLYNFTILPQWKSYFRFRSRIFGSSNGLAPNMMKHFDNAYMCHSLWLNQTREI